ncbi:MAG: hypothetical protein ABSH32_30350, partial [Bryobacteraceae bacterium]
KIDGFLSQTALRTDHLQIGELIDSSATLTHRGYRFCSAAAAVLSRRRQDSHGVIHLFLDRTLIGGFQRLCVPLTQRRGAARPQPEPVRPSDAEEDFG